MKLCYVDESGNDARTPALVMVGIVADQVRANRTRQEFGGLLAELKLELPSVKELKGSRLIAGGGWWARIPVDSRWHLVESLCQWLNDRKHSLVVAGVDRQRFRETTGELPEQLRDEWLAVAMHIALQLQKAHQSLPGNKGHTFLIFDENKIKVDALPDMLYEPSDWTDAFYERGPKQDKLDQIIDTAFFAKSHHADLVQVADLFAYVIRRHIELSDYGGSESLAGEADLYARCVPVLGRRVVGWPKRTTNTAARWFAATAPRALLALATR